MVVDYNYFLRANSRPVPAFGVSPDPAFIPATFNTHTIGTPTAVLQAVRLSGLLHPRGEFHAFASAIGKYEPIPGSTQSERT